MKKLISLILAASMMLTASACVLADEVKGGFSLKMQIDNPKMTVGGEEKSIDEEGTTAVWQSRTHSIRVRDRGMCPRRMPRSSLLQAR